MQKYILRKLLALIPKLLVISILLFLAVEWMPGDPLARILGPHAYNELTQAQKEAAWEAMGLSDPMPVRYLRWLGDILQGKFGYSLVGADIGEQLANLLPYTFELSLWALILSTGLGIIMGFLCAMYKNKFVDNFFQVFGIVGSSLPDFFLAIGIVLIFALELRWFPSGGRFDPDGRSRIWVLVLPIFTLTLVRTAGTLRGVRGNMVEVMEKDYIKTARSKGLSEVTVNIKHVLRNAMISLITGMVNGLVVLVSGSMIVEQVFNYAGLGQMAMEAQSAGDANVVLTMTMMTAVVALLCSTLADIALAMLDPRVRLGE